MTKKTPIALHEPSFTARDEDYVLRALRSTWVSTSGKFIEEFEKAVADYVGVEHAVSTSNGTTALHLAVEVLKRMKGVDGPFEVLAPSLTFVATLNAICHAGGVPMLLDCRAGSLNIDPSTLESLVRAEYARDAKSGRWINKSTNRPLLAVMPAHIMGWTCDMDLLARVCKNLDLPILEDAAEALGSRFLDGRHAGHHGLASCLSFNGNKIVTTGGGGMLLTNDDAFAKRTRHLATTAKTDGLRFVHDEVGYNFRLVNLLAALGCSQLQNLDANLKRKAEMFSFYEQRLKPHGITLHTESMNKGNHWIVNARFESHAAREAAMARLLEANVQCRPLWTPGHRLAYLQDSRFKSQDYAQTDAMWSTILSLPSSAHLTDSDLESICALAIGRG